MQEESGFHQIIETPLGLAVMVADTTGLTGFYFLDQRDCPVQFSEYDGQKISNPQAGQYDGVMLRHYRVIAPCGNAADKVRHHALYSKVNWSRGAALRQSTKPLKAGTKQRATHTPAPDSVLSFFEQSIQELDAYFRGPLKRFSVPLSLKGTDFQVKVWKTLATLPANQLISYAELGRQAGVSSGAYRAVGMAVGRNPLSIIVPCHRVVASNARLTGYGGGLERKVALLEHEGFHISGVC